VNSGLQSYFSPEYESILRVPKGGSAWRKALAFAGPGFLISVGYMDPGNWATDLAAGSHFNYDLLFVVFLSSLLAMLLQSLAVKLGVATGRDLAQACRESYPPAATYALWVVAEIAIVACDLAEVLGSAIALKLLFGIPLIWGVTFTAADVLLILLLQRRGFRYIEAFVIVLIGFVAACFAIELWLGRPDLASIFVHTVVPPGALLHDREMLYISVGILGATVMPHNLYLHSALVQTRDYDRSPTGRREAMKYLQWDSIIALSLAFFVNAAILILSAAVFHSGHSEVAEIGDAYRLLSPLLGAAAASTLFALALLASGQNSTLTGTLAGQIVMEGFLRLRLQPWLRRLITRLAAVVPAIIVIALYGESGTGKLLIFSQVVLSFQLSFAVVPLVRFTGDAQRMGEFANGRVMQYTAWASAAVIAILNIWLIVRLLAA